MTPQEYLETAKCYTCLGMTMGQSLVLAKLKAIILALDNTMATDSQTLLQRGACFACLGLSTFEVLQIVMLNIIEELITDTLGETCMFCGEGDPAGAPTGCTCAWYVNLLNSEAWYWDARPAHNTWYQFG